MVISLMAFKAMREIISAASSSLRDIGVNIIVANEMA